MNPAEALAELFRGAKGAAATLDLDEGRSGRPIRLAPEGGQEFRTPSGKLEFYSEQAGDGRPCCRCRTGSRIRKRCATRALAVAAVDRARLISRPTPPIRASIFCAARGANRIACCIRRRRSRRGLPDGAKVRVFNEPRRVGLVLKVRRRGIAGCCAGAGQRPDEETLGRHDQHAVLRPLYRSRATAPHTRARFSTSRPGSPVALSVIEAHLNRCPDESRDLFIRCAMRLNDGSRLSPGRPGLVCKSSTRQPPSGRATLSRTASGKRAER